MCLRRYRRVLMLGLIVILVSASLGGCNQALQRAVGSQLTAAQTQTAEAGQVSSASKASAAPTAASTNVKPIVKAATTVPTVKAATKEATSAPTVKATSRPKATAAPKPTATKAGAGDVTVIDQGWGQVEDQVGYAFLVKSNTNAIMGSISYQVVFYDAGDNILATDDNALGLLLPGQTLGIASTTSIADPIARMEVILSEGQVVETSYPEVISTGRITFMQTDSYVNVYGVVANPFEEDMEGVAVYAVLRDSAGKIIGGGANSLPFMNRTSTMGQALYATAGGEVASVELYASTWEATPWVTADERAGYEDVLLADYGYSMTEGTISYAALVENQTDRAVTSAQVWTTLYNSDDEVVGVFYDSVPLILPGETQAVSSATMLDDSSAEVAYIDVQLYVSAMAEVTGELPSFTSGNINYIADDWSPTVTAQVYNPYSSEIQWAYAIAVLYNADGEIVGGGDGNIDFIPANGKAAVEVRCSQMAEEPASIELYISASNLSDLTGE